MLDVLSQEAGDDAAVIAAVAPTLQRYATGPLA